MSAETFALELQSALTRAEVADAYLGSVKDVIDASAVGLYQLDQQSQRVLDVRVHSAADFLDEYERYGRDDDPVLEHVLTTGTAIDSSRLPGSQWLASGARHALGVGGFGHSLEAPVVTSGCLFGTINFARAVTSRPFSRDDVATAESIAKHLGRAVERAVRYEMADQRSRALEHTIERLSQPVIITDWDGRVVFQNRAAIDSCHLSEDLDGRLNIADSLSRAILDATNTFTTEGKRVQTQSIRTAAGKQLVVKTYRLADATRASATMLYERTTQASSARALPRWEVLTQREQQIVELVSEGLTTREIAERAFISDNTVKQHLKRIYAKIDVSTRAELIQLTWASSNSRTLQPGGLD
ncbi:LuxR C-terminal-related transcriptional regulator [Nocardioides sp. HM23]|uniref:LuxR C-terminal-related transcriptional regulator n=1 Tax=Nocardioides bizhenqiangii TaxID=3095076 RepID=UPI002ACAF6FF|nr:LuxR C-terminal-related transcriptional regulator [Nocardioides sp. HM23]MDZ5621062.1 LuxR C-terminal-related transcriptional regulator [Nocardioides sp. HM23]